MSELTDSLERFSGLLERAGSETLQHLRPGLPVEQIWQATRNAGYTLTEELTELWEWRNGAILPPAGSPMTEMGRVRCGPFLHLLSLDDAIALSERLYQQTKGDETYPGHDSTWHRDWIAVAGGQIPLAATTGSEATSRVYSMDPLGNVLSASTLRAWIDTWSTAIIDGWWFWDRTSASWVQDQSRIPDEIHRTQLV